jgi:hypothetical protein
MSRINIVEQTAKGPKVVGWFDNETAECFTETVLPDGNNHVSGSAGDQRRHEALYKTSGGRWVLARRSQGSPLPSHEFIDKRAAADWLRLNHHDPGIVMDDEEESQGDRPGRPEIGPPINVRLPASVIAELDSEAQSTGQQRAAVIRRILLERRYFKVIPRPDGSEPVPILASFPTQAEAEKEAKRLSQETGRAHEVAYHPSSDIRPLTAS